MEESLANGAREATEILLQGSWDGSGLLVEFEYDNRTNNNLVEDERQRHHGQEGMLWFASFVTALQQNHRIRRLTMYHGKFVSNGQRNDDDGDGPLNRLFRVVLSSHPSLTTIAFHSCELMSRYVELLTTSIITHQCRGERLSLLQELRLSDTPLDHQGTIAIANLLQAKNNFRLTSLDLYACKITSEGFETLLKAMNGNTHLRSLQISHNLISEISLTAVQSGLNNSQLVHLHLWFNPLTMNSLRILSGGLRTNTILEDLSVFLGDYVTSVDGEDLFAPFVALLEELVTWYNFSLRTLSIEGDTHPSQQKLNQILRRNDHVRCAHKNLQQNNNTQHYHVPLLSLWPQVLEQINSKFSLLYRFIRHGNLGAFTSHVAGKYPRQQQQQQQQRRRRREQPASNTHSREDSDAADMSLPHPIQRARTYY